MNKILLLFLMLVPLSLSAQYKRYHGDGVDDYLRFVPIVSVGVMKAAGVKSASSWQRLGVNASVSYALALGTTYGMKRLIHDRRPDGTDNHSFPSGHSSVAFAGATILHKEFHRVSPWISVAGYGVAALTAADRVRRNRHEWDDVLTGAAIGILATEAGYRLGDLITGYHSRYAVEIGPEGVMVRVNL